MQSSHPLTAKEWQYILNPHEHGTKEIRKWRLQNRRQIFKPRKRKHDSTIKNPEGAHELVENMSLMIFSFFLIRDSMDKDLTMDKSIEKIILI